MNYTRGELVFADIPVANDNKNPITRATSKEIGGHVVIVVSIQEATEASEACEAREGSITGYFITTLGGAKSLAATVLDPADYKWFLPVHPAAKESVHDVAPPSVVGSGSKKVAQWVNIKDRVTIPDSTIRKSVGAIAEEDLKIIEDALIVAANSSA